MAGRTGGSAGDAARTSVAGADKSPPRLGVAPAAVLTHSTHPGGVGAPPRDTTIPCQELADVDVCPSPLRTLASGMGQIPGPGLQGDQKQGTTGHPRNARPDAGDAALNCRQDRSRPELAENAAMERRKAQPAAEMAGHPKRDGPARKTGHRVRPFRAPASSGAPSPLAFLPGRA